MYKEFGISWWIRESQKLGVVFQVGEVVRGQYPECGNFYNGAARGMIPFEHVITEEDLQYGDIYSEYNPPALWNIVWSPEGRTIATVRAASMQAAKKLTPKPYSKFMGEVYVEAVTA